MAAATFTVSAPHATAVNQVAAALGVAAYGTVGSVVSFNIGNKRAVLCKLTGAGAGGTYATGGNAFTAASLAKTGLREVHAMFILASATANVRPNINSDSAQGTPVLLATTPGTPKIQYFDVDTETSAGGTIEADAFHAILIGI